MSIPNVNGSFVNTDNSHGMSYTFTNTMVPHTYPPCLKYLTGGKNKNKRYSMKSRRNRKFKTSHRCDKSKITGIAEFIEWK